MTTIMAAPSATAWLSLGPASRFLGVDESTLRAWANAGTVRAVRTPGGHRRFTREDLRALLDRGPSTGGPEVAVMIGRHGRRLARARPPGDTGWYVALGVGGRRAVRGICRGLMQALTGYLGEGTDRRMHQRSGIGAGRRLGRLLGRRRFTPAQTTEAFLHFRSVMIEAVTTRLALPPDRQVRALRQIDRFLNGVLLATLQALETGAVGVEER